LRALLLLLMQSQALFSVLLPFYGPLLRALIIALLFRPLYVWPLPRLSRRATLAALAIVLAVLTIVVLPFLLMTIGIVNQATEICGKLQTANGPRAWAWRCGACS